MTGYEGLGGERGRTRGRVICTVKTAGEQIRV